MKKRILSIITILGIGVSFCSADFFGVFNPYTKNFSTSPGKVYITYPDGYNCFTFSCASCVLSFYDSEDNLLGNWQSNTLICNASYYINSGSSSTYSARYYNVDFSGGGSSSCPDMLIDVKYNSGNISTITCDGINYITIDGFSTLTNSNINYEYSPYFNIDYTDEDNQILTESYSKNILYLSGGKFKKTYTGDNEWVLNNLGIGSEGNNITYTPVFDVTGTTDVLNTGNVFNNWSDNALKLLLSNVPGYIQYITIFAILLFLFGFLRRFKRKR